MLSRQTAAFGASRDIQKQAQVDLEQQARGQRRSELRPEPQVENAAGTASGAPAEASPQGTSRRATPYEDAGKQAGTPGLDISSSQAANRRAKNGAVPTRQGSSAASSAAQRSGANAGSPAPPSRLQKTQTPTQSTKLRSSSKLGPRRGQAAPQRLSAGN